MTASLEAWTSGFGMWSAMCGSGMGSSEGSMGDGFTGWGSSGEVVLVEMKEAVV